MYFEGKLGRKDFGLVPFACIAGGTVLWKVGHFSINFKGTLTKMFQNSTLGDPFEILPISTNKKRFTN